VAADTGDAGARIDAIVVKVGGWRGETLRRARQLILDAVPDCVEEIKWVKPSNPDGVPTWNRDGIICTGEVYKDKVKLTFAEGAALDDPHGLFNASLGGNKTRAIDIAEGTELDAPAFTALIEEAVDHNRAKAEARKQR
jgi:hypothetical protein